MSCVGFIPTVDQKSQYRNALLLTVVCGKHRMVHVAKYRLYYNKDRNPQSAEIIFHQKILSNGSRDAPDAFQHGNLMAFDAVPSPGNHLCRI